MNKDFETKLKLAYKQLKQRTGNPQKQWNFPVSEFRIQLKRDNLGNYANP